MRIASYPLDELYNLELIRTVRRWKNSACLSELDVPPIFKAYPSILYHPNLFIRILLFLATLIALSGVTGILSLLFLDLIASNDTALGIASICYGLISLFFLEKILIQRHHHFKSGVTEALLYHSLAFLLVGLAELSDVNTHFMLLAGILVFGVAAIRYLDWVSTIGCLASVISLVFYQCYQGGAVFQSLMPFIFMIGFGSLYLVILQFRKRDHLWPWRMILRLTEYLSLLMLYAAGNYFVVRELSVGVLDNPLPPGADIPLATLFYAFTVFIPMVYILAGLRWRNIELFRVGLLVVAFSAFTFKYYYGFEHPEITLTVAGLVLFLGAVVAISYLRRNHGGFTREMVLTEKWGNANLEAFIVGETVGGNHAAGDVTQSGGGGSFGGGGASGTYS